MSRSALFLLRGGEVEEAPDDKQTLAPGSPEDGVFVGAGQADLDCTSSRKSLSVCFFNTHECKMARTEDGLKVMAPEPVTDERTPFLNEANGAPREDQGGDAALEAQAEQERREHDVGAVPIAEEPKTSVLLATMGSLWISTFFAALGEHLHHQPKFVQSCC